MEEFFDLRGSTRKFVVNQSLGRGLFGGAFIYLLPDEKTVIKVYKNNTFECYRINYETFMYLKHYESSHLLRLNDLLYKERFLHSKKRILKKPQKHIVDAYTYDFVPKDGTRLVDMPVDYLLTNFRELEVMFSGFARDKFLVRDVIPDNSVLNQNGIVLIDPDLFMQVGDDYSCERVSYENKKELLELFKGLIKMEMYVDESILSRIFNQENAKAKNMTDEIAKTFSLAKKPIDLFKRW